mgnify:CR=1 FL=1
MFKILKNVLQATNVNKKIFFFNIFGMLVIALLEIISIGSIFPFLTLISQDKKVLLDKFPILENVGLDMFDFSNLIYLGLVLIIIIFILKNLTIFIFGYFQKKLFMNIQKINSTKAVNYYLSSDFNKKLDSPHILRNISYINQIFGWLSSSFSIIIESLILFFITLFLLMISFNATLIIIFFVILTSGLFRLVFKKKINFFSNENNILIKYNYKHLLNIINGLREIIIFNKEKHFSNLYNKSYDNMMSLNFKIKVIEFIPRILLEIVFILIFSFFLVFMFNKFRDFDLILPYIGVYFAAALKILPSISKLIMMANGLRYSSKQIDFLFEENEKIKLNELKQKQKLIAKSIDDFNEIRLENLSLNYDKNSILKNINLIFKKNKFYGIKGKSGSGKTSLLNILTGHLKPSSGKILIDKVDYLNFGNNWKKCVSIVPQEVFIINDTIANNVAFGENPDKVNRSKVKEVLNIAELGEFVSSQKEGVDSELDEKASNISGGQKQRIGIARALYKNPKLLILDEPTSSLDEKTSKSFINTLNKIRKNIIIIIATHNLENLDHCDEIYEIRNKDFKLSSQKNDKS